jgi:hypothetical protein
MNEQQGSGAAVRRWAEMGAGVALFLASAAVVLWQNAHLTVLWDVSYILETASRIAAGDVPYKDFAIPYAPLTFLVQASIIKLAGRVFWHHILYAAITGALASVLCWRVLLGQLRGRVAHASWTAFLLALPLIPLGIYAIFPHPFYDCDASLVMLLGLWMLQRSQRASWPALLSCCTGAVLVLPVFIKQNTGLIFAACSLLAIVLLVLRGGTGIRRGGLWLLAGAASALAIALLLLQATAGLGNYLHWTVQFAGSRRLPGWAAMLTVYSSPALLVWLAAALGALALLRFAPRRWWSFASAAVLLLLPYLWSVAYLLMDNDSSERAERLLAVWPYTLILVAALALWRVRRGGVEAVMPFVLIGMIHGAFLSQQLWGSTYALWPFLLILCGDAVVNLRALRQDIALPWRPLLAVAMLSATLLVAGGSYAFSHERLSYANPGEGELHRSSLPALRGLAMSGDFLPEFEELVRFTGTHIPPQEGILMLPGEDLFYFTTGRRPVFPSLMFDHTVNPYNPAEIAALAAQHRVVWVVVKRNQQLGETPFDGQSETLRLLAQAGYEPFDTLDNYQILRLHR